MMIDSTLNTGVNLRARAAVNMRVGNVIGAGSYGATAIAWQAATEDTLGYADHATRGTTEAADFAPATRNFCPTGFTTKPRTRLLRRRRICRT